MRVYIYLLLLIKKFFRSYNNMDFRVMRNSKIDPKTSFYHSNGTGLT